MIIKIMGGLGNQLFIYAFGYALFREKNCKNLLLETENYDIYDGPKYMLDYFELEHTDRLIHGNKVINNIPKLYKLWRLFKLKVKRISVLEEKELFLLQQDVYSQRDRTLFIGYWQNYRYFDKYRKDIVRQFRLQSVDEVLQKAIAQINEHCVAVHIRRGDYKTYCGGKCLSTDYYHEVMNECCKEDNRIQFYIFTDDVTYCKSVFGDYNIVIVAERYSFTDIEEFYFMSNFHKFVIANSTFSWWAAYISESEEVYAPVVDMWKEDFYPEKWKRVQAKIEHL